MKDKEIKVDVEKFDEERRKKIIESGKYLEFTYLQSHDDTLPVCEMRGNASKRMVGELLIGIEKSLDMLKEEYKEEYLIAKIVYNVNSKIIDLGGKNE